MLELDYYLQGGEGRGEERRRDWLRFYTNKEGDLTHTQQNPPVYGLKTGSSAYPREGDQKGWVKEEETEHTTPPGSRGKNNTKSRETRNSPKKDKLYLLLNTFLKNFLSSSTRM